MGGEYRCLQILKEGLAGGFHSFIQRLFLKDILLCGEKMKKFADEKI